MPAKSHRSRYDIANEVLHIILNAPVISRRHKTGIGYAASLTHKQTVTFLRGLINQGLLRISQDKGPYGYYEITEKGLRYLQVFAEMKHLMQPIPTEEELLINYG